MLCEEVWSGCTRRVIASLAHVRGPYARIQARLRERFRDQGDSFHAERHTGFLELAAELQAVASRHGMEFAVCCSPRITAGETGRYGVRHEGCISARALMRLAGGVTDGSPVG